MKSSSGHFTPQPDDIYRLDGEEADALYFMHPHPPGGGKRKTISRIWKIEVPMDTESTLRRLKTVEGHLRGVIRMVEEDAYCIDVIRQIQAVEAALNKVSAQILGFSRPFEISSQICFASLKR